MGKEITITGSNLPAHGVRPEIESVCYLGEQIERYFDPLQALASLKRRGLVEQVPPAAESARRASLPVDHNRLTDRLTALGMMMAPNRAPAEAAVWLREMARLLSDLPEDILGEAIDEKIRTCKFLPTCSEIREIADPLMARRRRLIWQLEEMTRIINSGAPIPDFAGRSADPPVQETPCTPEQAGEILDELGIDTAVREDIAASVNIGEPRKPTRQDYIDMGVDPAVLDRIADESPRSQAAASG